MIEENYMLTNDDCGNCDLAKEILKDAIANGRIKTINIKTPEGIALVEKHKINALPTVINKKDMFEQVCHLSKDAKKLYCDDGSEKVI